MNASTPSPDGAAVLLVGFFLGYVPTLLLHALRKEPDPDVLSSRRTMREFVVLAILYVVGLLAGTPYWDQARAQLSPHQGRLFDQIPIAAIALFAIWLGIRLGRFFGFRSRTRQQRTGRPSVLGILREQLGYPALPPVSWAPCLGRLTRWDDQRGFGFIQPEQPGVADLFVHARAFRGRRRPQAGQRVRFTMAVRDGDVHAATATILGFAVVPSTITVVLLVTAVVLTLAVNLHSLAVTSTLLHSRTLLAVLFMSLVTFYVYRVDVDRARRAAWRIPEWRLHLLELLGGWPGALVAQWYYRHKRRKRSYQVVFWLIVVLTSTTLWVATRFHHGMQIRRIDRDLFDEMFPSRPSESR